MKWFANRTSNIAIDVGLEGVRAVQLARRENGIQFRHCVAKFDAMQEDTDSNDRFAAQYGRLARIVKQRGWRGNTASVALQPPEASFTILDVPKEMFGVRDDEWNTMLRCEAARVSQADPDDLEVAAWPLPSRRPDGGTVMLTFAQRAVTLELRKLVHQCGLEVARVDVFPLALLRAGWTAGIPGLPENPQTALWGMLEIGARTSLFIVGYGSRCVYVRELGFSGDQFSRDLAEAMEIDFAVADRVKRDMSLPASTVGGVTFGQAAEGTNSLTSVATLAPPTANTRGFRKGFRTITAETRRALTFAIERFADASPTGLYLTGGGSQLVGLREHLEENLGLPVIALTPRDVLGADSGGQSDETLDDPRFLAACGLALGDLP